MPHRYGLGQVVCLAHTRLRGVAADGRYEVVRLLPPDGPSNQYRIKAMGESFERLVQEHEIVDAAGLAASVTASVKPIPSAPALAG